MNRRAELGTVLLILVVLAAGASGVADPSHFASSGVAYETNSGLEVTLADDRDVEAVPFDGDETFASDNATLSSPGDASASVSDQTFEGDTMSVTQIDATNNPVTLGRGDLSSDVTVEDGDASVIAHDVGLDDNETDLEVSATTATNITIEDVPDVDGIQAVDEGGEAVAGETDTSDGTVTLSLEPGEYDLRLQDGPSSVSIRDLTNESLIDGENMSVELEFFGDDGTVEERTTTNGTIDMTGLPADERFSVSVETNGTYVQRQVIIPSILEQKNVWLLPDSDEYETVEPRFLIEDPSNQFDAEESEVILERAIEFNGSTEYRAVAGDRVGLNGFDPLLERDQRYRVVVRDPESGSERVLGEFTPTTSETVTLTVQDVEFDSVSDIDGVEWTGRYIENEDEADEIEFIYRDSLDTDTIDYRIYERGNESNVLVDESATGNVTTTEAVPENESGTVWTVEWEATREDGETLNASRPVSTNQLPVGPGLAPEWQTAVSLVGLIAIAGLFGAVNPGVGGIAVAGAGGMFYLIGWLPDTTGGLMVILALFIAVLSYVGQKARGATA